MIMMTKNNACNTQPQQAAQPQSVKFAPTVDIYQTAEAVTLVADVPGVQAESLDLTVEGRTLTIRGKVAANPPADHTQAHAEYQVGDYERSFNLSDKIDINGIQATLADGVLKLTLPVAKPEHRKVQVQGAPPGPAPTA